MTEESDRRTNCSKVMPVNLEAEVIDEETETNGDGSQVSVSEKEITSVQ